MKELTFEEMRVVLDHGHWRTVNKWLERGDGIAVYRNAAMDSGTLGDRRFVSFGSQAAQLPTTSAQLPMKEDWEKEHESWFGWTPPPQRLPDIGSQINWKFQLEGIYKGKPLEHEEDCRFITDINSDGSAPMCKCREEANVLVFDREQVQRR